MIYFFKKSWSLIVLTILLALGGCGYGLVDDGSGFLKTKSGQMVAWPSGGAVRFETDPSVPNELREQIALGQENINNEIERVQVSVRLQSSQAPRITKNKDDVIGDGINGIYFLPEPWPWPATGKGRESHAMTVLRNKGTVIVEADIFYRASAFSAKYSGPAHTTKQESVSLLKDSDPNITLDQIALNTQYVTPALGRDEKWTKVAFIHECMHALGFTHVTDDPDSIMYPTVSTSLYENPFSAGDLSRLQLLY